MRARYYAPTLMRFVNADALEGSLADPQTLNRFAYVNGNPISYVDPFGRSAAAASIGHTALDGAGFIPVVGAVFDVANGVWYAVEGDWTNAGLSALGAIPGFGDIASGAKIGVKAASTGADAFSAASKGVKAEKAGSIAGKDLIFGNSAKSSKKISNQMADRGWTESSVQNTVDSSFTTRKSTNKATKNSATVYYTEEGAYVVVDDVTKEVVQVSDKNKLSSWYPDDTIIDPYIP